MTRRLAALDRLLTLLAGLALLLGGVGVLLWTAGPLQRGGLFLDLSRYVGADSPYSRVGVPEVGPTLDVGWLPSTVAMPWFWWVEAVVGVVLGLLGLRWFVAHLPRRSVHRVALEGDTTLGRLDADLGVVADTAADALSGEPGIESATASVHRERRATVIELTAVVPATARLGHTARTLDAAAADLQQALGDTCPAVRSWIRVKRP